MKDTDSQMLTTGHFARLCGVTERALRLYAKKGLLKPAVNPENGYHFYSSHDMLIMQKILMFKKLGFSLEEIAVLLARDNKNMIETLQEQRHLVQQKIREYESLDQVLRQAIAQAQRSPDDSWCTSAIQALKQNSQLVEQYKNADNLSIRIRLHEKYSQNPISWFAWLFHQFSFYGVNRFLEVGCGSGELWRHADLSLRQREIFLSDISSGMVEEAKSNLNEQDFSFMVFDLCHIPFRDSYFDAVAANHVLFYLPDVRLGIQEIARVLRPGGTLYASAYGPGHMKEITELVQEFDSRIILSQEPLYEAFGTENGQKLLETCFESVEYRPYPDSLIVDSPRDLADYILSCHGNQNEIIMPRYDEFMEFLQGKLTSPLKITKEAGVFIASHAYLP